VKGAARVVLLLTVVAATIGCDRVTKSLAMDHLAGGPDRSFLVDTLRLEYTENPGAFLSLGSGLPAWARTTLFVYGTALSLIVIPVLALRLPAGSPGVLGLCLIWAGGASNLVDRVARGSVVDFLNVGIGPLRTGIFNVADFAITLGAFLVIVGWGLGVRLPRLRLLRRTAGER
jgi:signal peptidase II